MLQYMWQPVKFLQNLPTQDIHLYSVNINASITELSTGLHVCRLGIYSERHEYTVLSKISNNNLLVTKSIISTVPVGYCVDRWLCSHSKQSVALDRKSVSVDFSKDYLSVTLL